MKALSASLRMFLVLTILTGVIYPVAVSALARLIFPYRAGGSLLVVNGRVVGSELIGQQFTGDRYFHSRPSAASYDPLASSASNLSVVSTALAKQVEERRQSFVRENALSPRSEAPADMLFASGSGLDPHISPEAARMQVQRVAARRGLTDASRTALATIVERSIERRQLGFLGEPRVNVVLLNRALDSLGAAYRERTTAP